MGVVLEALSGDIALSMGRHDRGILDGLIRKWRGASAEDRALMTEDFRSLLHVEDLKRRSAAVLFFEAVPADDAGQLHRAMTENPERFDHVPDPWFGHGELRVIAATALSNRELDEATLDAVRGEALRPRLGHRMVPGLLKTDRAWILANAAKIIENTPEALATFVEHTEADALETCVTAARTALRPEVFEGVLQFMVLDEALRAKVLAL
ncbi:MAG: hypothetical protein KC912_15275 [Proteobacteria bacterium]|nr:hypothetical protein [Pseudomonadota bacterium]